MMRRRALLALPALLSVAHEARPSAGPIVLGTSTPGGGFARYGETLATLVNRRAGRTLVVPRATRGTVENLDLLARGSVDAALVQGTAASSVLGDAAGDADGALAILFAMYPSPALLAVPAASTARRFEDLRGDRVVFGVRTSGLVTLARQVFTGIDLDIDRDFIALYVDAAEEAPRLVISGQARGLWGAGEGWPGFEVLAAARGGARFLAPTAAQIQKIVARYPALQPMQVAPGAYAGIERPLGTVGSLNWILARRDLDDARATAFVDALDAAAPELAAALPQAAFSTLANTLAATPSRALLHRVLQTRI